MESTYRASAAGRLRRRPKSFEQGRSCADGRCDTRLSRYNPEKFCHLHAPVRFRRLRGEFSPEWQAERS